MARTKWTNEMLAAEAAKYETKVAFKTAAASAYATARMRKILPEICSHMVPGRSIKWTKKALAEEAAKYETIASFKKESVTAYNIMGRRGLTDNICGHMKRLHESRTNKEVAAEAAKYETRSDFIKGSYGAYQVAQRRNLLDEICDHMVEGSRSDNDAIYIWKAIGVRYNGKDVYKVGVTSARLDDQRIGDVAMRSGMEAKIVILKAVDGKATDLEKQIHAIGNDPQFTGFGGCTEFRAMDDEELAQAVTLIQETT